MDKVLSSNFEFVLETNIWLAKPNMPIGVDNKTIVEMRFSYRNQSKICALEIARILWFVCL